MFPTLNWSGTHSVVHIGCRLYKKRRLKEGAVLVLSGWGWEAMRWFGGEEAESLGQCFFKV